MIPNSEQRLSGKIVPKNGKPRKTVCRRLHFG